MTREDLTFSSDELGEIFGTATAVKKEEPKKAEAKDAPAVVREIKTLVVQNKFAEMEMLSEAVPDTASAETPQADVESLIRRAEELEKKAAMENEAPRAAAGGAETGAVLEFFEEIRKTLSAQLEPKAGKKAIENMMLRTLEKTAAANPVLKNTNWDSEGNLRLNGTIDRARLVKNLEACGDRISADQALALALSSLLRLRLNSIKQGLGQDAHSAAVDALVRKAGMIKAGYSAGTAWFFTNSILNPCVTNGDEIK